MTQDNTKYTWLKDQIQAQLKPKLTWRDLHTRDYRYLELWATQQGKNDITEEDYYTALVQNMLAYARLFNYTSPKQAFIAMLYFLEHGPATRDMWDDLEVFLFSDDLEAKRIAVQNLENYFSIEEVELSDKLNPHT